MRRATLLALCAACATGSTLRIRADAIAQDVKLAREQNAETCAPAQLAVAEANLRFAQIELDQGDAVRAGEHLATAAPAAREAVRRSKNCANVAAVTRETPDAGAAKDSDADGVPDVDDLCPDVPGPKENHGCPVTADRDGDGVPDEIDRCPDVPGPRENFGCPWADRDHDGVPDKDDKCPDEPGPADNAGCPREQKLVVVRRDRIELKQQIHFRQTKAAILPESDAVLDQVAQALKDMPDVRVRIEGHTDPAGGLKRNMKLSQDRANAVRRYLIRRGVPAKQLVVVGYGPTRPIASNATRAGRALNRRVEFRIVSGEPSK